MKNYTLRKIFFYSCYYGIYRKLLSSTCIFFDSDVIRTKRE